MNNNTKALFKALNKRMFLPKAYLGFNECEGCFRSRLKGFYVLYTTTFLIRDTHGNFDMQCPSYELKKQLKYLHD